MADPTKYTPAYSYSGWQATNPSRPLPADEVDNDFANIQRSMNETIDAVKDVRRSDGKLKNQSVGPDQLSPALTIGFSFTGTWIDGHSYSAGDGVVKDDTFYSARIAHTADVSNAPGNDAYWNELFSLNDIVVTGGMALPRDSFVGDGVTKDFTLSFTPLSKFNLFVQVGGVVQGTDAYSSNGNTLSFINPPPNGYGIEVRGFATVSALVVPEDGSVDTEKLADQAVTEPKLSVDVAAKLNGAMQKATYDPETVGGDVFDSKNWGFFDTHAEFVASNLRNSVGFVCLQGFGAVGDGGWQILRRFVGTPAPIEAWHVQDAGGNWWQRTLTEARPEHFAAITYVSSPYGATEVAAASDASPALDAASSYATTFGVPCRLLGRWYKRTTEWVWTSTLNIEGEGIGRWSPTLNQSIAGGVGKPDGAGTVVLYVGTGAKTRRALGVTDMRTAGGVVVNADSREPGFDDKFKLTDYYHEDGNTTTGAAATPVSMSVGVYMPPGTHGITARGFRIMPSFNGLAGYEAGTLALGDDWDIGFYFDNTEWCNFIDIQGVGYWRKHGRLIRAGIVASEQNSVQTGCEHLIFENCTFTGAAAGSAIRGPDRDRVTGVGADYVEIEWRENHPYDPTLLGNTFRLGNGAGSFFGFTGLSKTGATLRLTGVTPNPAAAGVTTSSHITPGNGSNGIDNTTDYNCALSGLDHQGAVRATSASLAAARLAKPSACIEISGWRLQGYRAIFTELITHDDVGFHLHDCSAPEFSPSIDIESKTADGLGLGMVCIGSPAEGGNTRVANPAGQTFFLTVDAREVSTDFRPFLSTGTARFPTAPVLGGYLQANQFKYTKQQFINDNDTYFKPPNDRRVGFKDNAGAPRFFYDDLTGNLEASLANGATMLATINGMQVLKAKVPAQGLHHADTDGIPHAPFFAIANDGVASLDFGVSLFSAIIEVAASNGATPYYGKFVCRAATGPACVRVLSPAAGTAVNAATGVLNGTTGASGDLRLSVDAAGKVYVQNRTGGSLNVQLTIAFGNYST